jgi:hypothetical protein
MNPNNPVIRQPRVIRVSERRFPKPEPMAHKMSLTQRIKRVLPHGHGR